MLRSFVITCLSSTASATSSSWIDPIVMGGNYDEINSETNGYQSLTITENGSEK